MRGDKVKAKAQKASPRGAQGCPCSGRGGLKQHDTGRVGMRILRP